MARSILNPKHNPARGSLFKTDMDVPAVTGVTAGIEITKKKIPDEDPSFKYEVLSKDLWYDKIGEAKEAFGIYFDLENDDAVESKTFKFQDEDTDYLAHEFRCELRKAGGDWEWPSMYFRCQCVDGMLETAVHPEVISQYTTYAFFVVIPPVEGGNTRLVEGDNGTLHTMSDEPDAPDLDEAAAWEWLEAYLQVMVEEQYEPTAEENKVAPMAKSAGEVQQKIMAVDGPWIGAVTAGGDVVETHTLEEAREHDYYHRLYFSAPVISRLDVGDLKIFWINEHGYPETTDNSLTDMETKGILEYYKSTNIANKSAGKGATGIPTTLTLYHGTRIENLDGIKEMGLINTSNSAGWYMLADNEEDAVFHSASHTRQPILVTFQVPCDNEHWEGHPHLWPPAEAGHGKWYAPRETLSPAFITGIREIPADEQEKATLGSNIATTLQTESTTAVGSDVQNATSLPMTSFLNIKPRYNEYADKVFHQVVNALQEEQHISEKNFKAMDALMAEVTNLFDQPETIEGCAAFEAHGDRPQMCAEVILATGMSKRGLPVQATKTAAVTDRINKFWVMPNGTVVDVHVGEQHIVEALRQGWVAEPDDIALAAEDDPDFDYNYVDWEENYSDWMMAAWDELFTEGYIRGGRTSMYAYFLLSVSAAPAAKAAMVSIIKDYINQDITVQVTIDGSSWDITNKIDLGAFLRESAVLGNKEGLTTAAVADKSFEDVYLPTEISSWVTSFQDVQAFISQVDSMSGIPMGQFPIDEIDLTTDFARKELADAAEDYATGYNKKSVDPVRLFFKVDTGTYEMIDGYHRLCRTQQQNKTTIPATVELSGTPKNLKNLYTYVQQHKTAAITLPIEKGDEILTGHWMNHKEKVKTIGEDKHGQPTVNGKPILRVRIPELMATIKQALSDSTDKAFISFSGFGDSDSELELTLKDDSPAAIYDVVVYDAKGKEVLSTPDLISTGTLDLKNPDITAGILEAAKQPAEDKLPQLYAKAREFKSAPEFIQSFYRDTWSDSIAFGYIPGVQPVDPKLLKIKWQDDWSNADPFDVPVADTPPIEVVYENNALYVEDGHHRLKTALKQNASTIMMDLAIKQSPFTVLPIKSDKDLQQLWNKATGVKTADTVQDLLPGRFDFGDGCYIDLREEPDESLTIDRIFVDPKYRGQGRSKVMLSEIVALADLEGITLNIVIAPDRADSNEEYDKITDNLDHLATELGFESNTVDGEVIRLDKTRQPRKTKESTSRKEISIMSDTIQPKPELPNLTDDANVGLLATHKVADIQATLQDLRSKGITTAMFEQESRKLAVGFLDAVTATDVLYKASTYNPYKVTTRPVTSKKKTVLSGKKHSLLDAAFDFVLGK